MWLTRPRPAPSKGVDIIDIEEASDNSAVVEDTENERDEGPPVTDDDIVDMGGEDTSNVEEAIVFTLYDVGEIINELDLESLSNEESATELANAVDFVLTMLDEGMYDEALAILENDILQRTNGCATIGKPDEDDWIMSFEGQEAVYPLVLGAIELCRVNSIHWRQPKKWRLSCCPKAGTNLVHP